MSKLNIYETSRAGSIQGVKMFHESVAHNKFGRVIAPKNKEEDDDLLNGPGFGVAYWKISPEDLKGEADLRINKILSPEKVDKLFALPEKEQISVIEMLNENFDALISESLSTSGNMSFSGISKTEKENDDEENESDGKEGSESDGGEPAIPYDDITVKDLHEILNKANIEFDPRAKKDELYRIVYPEVK